MWFWGGRGLRGSINNNTEKDKNIFLEGYIGDRSYTLLVAYRFGMTRDPIFTISGSPSLVAARD